MRLRAFAEVQRAGKKEKGKTAMQHEEAMQHALGYAAGREDASGTRTHPAPDGTGSGFIEFAHAYATGWDDYNTGKRGNMTNARDAYDKWQSSGGTSVFAPGDATTDHERRAAEHRARGEAR